ncbi:carbamoyltransferase family protein [Candidatus Venteria ishoeyi]|uniref:Decarbamoylnovobiocin carbamoyltransferase n=1 Tax=Candidatus Venteria ishoeyi TaxID=1899563 RepID=A0A1H6FJJ4_9GAMM|nr:carbamoyltransferase [Candidatus Venteria ishoeyi]SEH09215.1 Decarbamoylnovobiocin carbamoyltransferase [Candidatus Venteria ishoeyi]SEH09340.1 Decarbamoylnovobiocin carbamoyltransferase [Candidatus Venteria ishoeyi]
MNILGISAYYHDSAAALVQSGKITAAAQEERFSRKKHDARFPVQAVQACLNIGKISLADVDYIVFYDKPLIKFERLLETYLSYAPKGFRSFVQAMPIWLKEKLYLKTLLKKELSHLLGAKASELPPLLFTEHHQSHAASAFFPSPFEKAGVLCMDGVGEWATTSVWLGEGNQLLPQWEIDFPHSLGLLYSAFTYYTGFKVNSGEYKLMGLAPYGEPKYVQTILDNLIDLKEDGTFRLNMDYFNYTVGLTMTNSAFDKCFGGPPRKAEADLTQREMDIASSIQVVTEEAVIRLVRTVSQELETENLCLAGGVALNCVANGRILRGNLVKNLWIQPAAGDAGGALGAALSVWHEYLDKPRQSDTDGSIADNMQGSYLGTSSSNKEIKTYLDTIKVPYEYLADDELFVKLAEILDSEQVIGWFQGRMEFGPRALGNRSILGDPRSTKMQSIMNLKIKYRESFRPFAPSVLHDHVSDYFEMEENSPYMLLVAHVKPEHHLPLTAEQKQLFGIDKLNVPRSTIPAITHLDYSARVQTVHPETNPRYYGLIKAFENRTGCPILVNTSFNVRGEPLVCTPQDAYRCFMRTEMDYLVLENYLIAKKDQPEWAKDEAWKEEFELD